MAPYKRGNVWWYKFFFAGGLVRESARTHSKTIAKLSEKKRRRELEEGYNGLTDQRSKRVETLAASAKGYLADYRLRHRSVVFAEYAVRNVVRHLGDRMLVDVSDQVVKSYQTERLREGAAPKTINEEVGFLLRLLGDNGELIRSRLRRQKALKLTVPATPGLAYSEDDKEALIVAAQGARSPLIYPALMLALNTALRDAEIRHIQWGDIDLTRRVLTVGKSKTAAGEGRKVPMNSELLPALADHRDWYIERFGTIRPDWYVFPFGKANQLDPSRPVTTLKTAWNNVRTKAGVRGRWHDMRHTVITELSESGEGDQTIMDIAGHVSRQMLARYSHIRMEAKRAALEKVGTGRSRRSSDGNKEVRKPMPSAKRGHKNGHTGRASEATRESK